MITSKISDIRTNTDTFKTAKSSRYRPEIDGLRAFAVVAVIINHFNKDILPGGYLGVDIFFVISGYVITSSLFGRPSKDFKDFISGFYERRIKRLIPALSVFVLIISVAISLFNPEPVMQLSIGRRALFGFSNIALYNQSTDYFAQSTELNVFTHTWSLGVEEQFYILFPFLIWFSGVGRQTKNCARNLFLIVGPLTIISLIGFIYLYPRNQPAAYFLMPARFWEMAAGCLIFIGVQKRVTVEQFLEKVPPLLVLALMIGVMYLPMSWAVASTIIIVVLSSVLIACLKKQTAAFKLFTKPTVVYIGLISYSLYLWHWGVLAISRWTIGIYWWSVPFQVALMLALAVASYRWIEIPLRKATWFGKRWKTLLVGGGVLVMLSGGLVALAKPLKGKIYSGNYQYENLITRSRGYEDGTGAYSGKNCHFKSDKFSLEKSMKNCYLQGSKSRKTFYFAGNSHADHYRELNYLLNVNDGIGIFSATMSGCTFLGKQGSYCQNSQAEIEQWILQNIKKGDVVFISNRYWINSDKKMFTHIDQSWMKGKSTMEEINAFNKKVVSKGGKTVLMMPLPEYDVGIAECKPMWFRPFQNPKCSKSINDARLETKDVYSLIANNLDESVFVYDPLQSLCRKDVCSLIDGQSKPLYADDDHITDYANRMYIYPHLRSFAKMNGLL